MAIARALGAPRVNCTWFSASYWPCMSQFWTSVLDFCNTTVVRVGDQLLAELDTARASRKADGSLVTQLDIWADETLRTDIAVTFPDHGVLSEEAEHVFPGTEWCWVIDPIDGTTNFVRGIPLWAISLGLLYHGTPVFGYVHVPPLNQSFYGYRLADVGIEDPVGAYCNGKRIHTSPDALSRKPLPINLLAQHRHSPTIAAVQSAHARRGGIQPRHGGNRCGAGGDRGDTEGVGYRGSVAHRTRSRRRMGGARRPDRVSAGARARLHYKVFSHPRGGTTQAGRRL